MPETMEKIRKGDDVIVTAGKDKGKRGTVLRIVDARHLVVEGVNRVKKHQRPNPVKGLTGGIVDKDMPIDVSNVALYNPQTKKAISTFKVRKGLPVGCMVTLRGKRMYEFLDRLVTVAIPRIRDFRGISSRAFDGRGNYSLGVKEQIIFPEIEYDKIDVLRGL